MLSPRKGDNHESDDYRSSVMVPGKVYNTSKIHDHDKSIQNRFKLFTTTTTTTIIIKLLNIQAGLVKLKQR